MASLVKKRQMIVGVGLLILFVLLLMHPANAVDSAADPNGKFFLTTSFIANYKCLFC